MLYRLSDGLWDRVSGHLTGIIHGAGAAAVTFSGLSLEQMVLVFPAAVSALISILAFIAKRYDAKRRRDIYQEEERRRTEAIEGYLRDRTIKRHTVVSAMEDVNTVRNVEDTVTL